MKKTNIKKIQEEVKIEQSDITGITLDSVKGYKEEKEEIKKFINLLKNFDEYKQKGIYIPKGLILQGPPGTGKTLFAKAIANGCGLPFYNFQAENSGEKTLSKLIETFNVAKENKPAIIYIDEIDKLVGKRYFGSDIVRSLTQYLLTELDGLNSEDGLMIIASTNEYRDVPDSLTRSGRIDKKIKVNCPDLESRIEILKYYMKDHYQFSKININKLALKIEGLTGADIKTLVNNTLIDCVDDKEYITEDDFIKSVTELNFEDIGRRWKNPRAREDVIIHELGHSIVGYVLSGNHGAINCLKYGNSGGHTSFDEEDEFADDPFLNEEIAEESEVIKEVYNRVTKKTTLHLACVAFGGIAAEEVFFGDHFAGGDSDMQTVNKVFESAIDNYWFGEKPLFDKKRANKLKIKLWRKLFKKTIKIVKKNKSLIIFLTEKVKLHEDVLSYEQLDDYIKEFENQCSI